MPDTASCLNHFSESVIREMTQVAYEISAFGFDDDTEFCVWLAKERGFAAVPGLSFFRIPVNHLARLHFAKQETTLVEAGERLGRLREKI